MTKDAANQLIKDRTRYLNIVYFVESARSHTIRINLMYARWALGVGFIILTWAVASIFWVATLEFQIYATRERLESTLATIFDYQIKNDNVFEKAYPSEETNSYYSEAANLASNSPVEESKNLDKNHLHASVQVTAETNTKQDEKLKTSNEKALAHESKIDSTATPSTVKDAAKNKSKQNIGISNTKVSKSGNKFTLIFDISNPSQQKAEGFIWAVAVIKQNDGKSQFLAAPEHSKINNLDGSISDFKSTYRFSIQRFKTKSFEFSPPAASDWSVTSLKIFYSDLSGSKTESIEVPVEQANISNKNDSDTAITK